MAKRTRKLSEREAWRLLAKVWRGPLGGPPLCAVNERGNFGLCSSVCDMHNRGEISDATRKSMYSALNRCRPKHAEWGGYYWECNQEGAIKRAEFCERRAATLKRKAEAKRVAQ